MPDPHLSSGYSSPWSAHTELSSMAEAAVPATVQVLTDSGSGSGFIVHPDGLVVTARHVVEENDYSLRTVSVRLLAGTKNSTIVDAVVFRSHRQLDFALMWLLANGPFSYLPITNSKSLRYAQVVLAVGFPSGLINTVSAGIVANPAQHYRGVDYIQTNANIDPGNSGGPLIASGGVVGIIVAGLGNLGAAKLAVPVDYLTNDIRISVAHGRDRCLAADYCPACGHIEYSPATWYCRNCGVQTTQEKE